MNKLSYDDVKSNLYKRGYILLEENYKNTRNKILVEDLMGINILYPIQIL